LGRIDIDTATATWNKRFTLSDSGTFPLPTNSNTVSMVDDENGTDGTVSVFMIKGGNSVPPIRIYRVIFNKADGSVSDVKTLELSVDNPSFTGTIWATKIGVNYLVAFEAKEIPNPCGGRNLQFGGLLASVTPNMAVNWIKVQGEGVRNRSVDVDNNVTIFQTTYPKFDVASAGIGVPYFIGKDDTHIYYTSSDQGGSWGHNNNYIKVDFLTGAVVDTPDLVQTGTPLSTGNAIHSRSADVGSDGSIYTDAFTAGSVLGQNDYIKWSNGSVQWYKRYNFGGTPTTYGQSVLERNGKLLIANQIQYSTGSYDLRICLVDPSDGSVIPNSGKIIEWKGGTTKNIGSTNLNIIPMANSSGAVICTQVGTFVRIDVDNLPVADRYPMIDQSASNYWEVIDINVTSQTLSTFGSTANNFSGLGCSTFQVGSNFMPTLTDVAIAYSNPTVTANVEDNPTFGIDRIGGYYS